MLHVGGACGRCAGSDRAAGPTPPNSPSAARARGADRLRVHGGGTLAYRDAHDVHRARLFGTVADKTGIVPFVELVDLVMTTEPYASAHTVHWIVDNGSSHDGQRSIDRMTAAWSTAKVVHMPIHASLLNQIEIPFSAIQLDARRGRQVRRWPRLSC